MKIRKETYERKDGGGPGQRDQEVKATKGEKRRAGRWSLPQQLLVQLRTLQLGP